MKNISNDIDIYKRISSIWIYLHFKILYNFNLLKKNNTKFININLYHQYIDIIYTLIIEKFKSILSFLNEII